MLLSEAFEAFEIDELIGENRTESTVAKYRDCRNSLTKSIGQDIHIELLAYTHVINWKKFMAGRGNATTYIAQQLRNFRRVLTYLKSHGFTSLDPSEVSTPKGAKPAKTAWFNREEVISFLRAIDNPRDLALYSMMFCSGARISEVLQLNRGDITGNSAFTRGKGQRYKESELYFDDRSLILLDRYLEARTDRLPALFVSRNHGRITVKTAIYNFHKYREKAGIKLNGRGATHILRHSFGTHLDLNGMDLEDLRKQLRHTKLDTTKIYVHSGEANRRTDWNKYHTPTPI